MTRKCLFFSSIISHHRRKARIIIPRRSLYLEYKLNEPYTLQNNNTHTPRTPPRSYNTPKSITREYISSDSISSAHRPTLSLSLSARPRYNASHRAARNLNNNLCTQSPISIPSVRLITLGEGLRALKKKKNDSARHHAR